MTNKNSETKIKLQKTIQQIIIPSEVSITTANIKAIKKYGKTLTLTPRKKEKAKALILYFKLNKKTTLDELYEKMENITNKVRKKGIVTFGYTTTRRKQNKTYTIYAY